MQKKKKKYYTCPWYLIFVFWNKRDVEVVMSPDKRKIISYRQSLAEDPEKQAEERPLNGQGDIPKMDIHEIPGAGLKRGPTQKSIKIRFFNLLPPRAQIKFTKI